MGQIIDGIPGVDKIMAVDKAEHRQNIFNRHDLNAALHQLRNIYRLKSQSGDCGLMLGS